MTKKEKTYLFNEANVKDCLTLNELLTLSKWEWLNRSKLDTFFHNLKIGKHAKAAFQDAKDI